MIDQNQEIQCAHAIDGGKKNDKLEARVSDDLKEAFRRKWLDSGFASESECLEKLAAVFAWGPEHVRMMEERKIRRVSLLSDVSAVRGS